MYENDGGLLSPRDAYRLMLKDYPDVMDIGQMCEALGVSTKTGYKLLKDGKIEYLKIGRAYRIPKAHILRYLKSPAPLWQSSRLWCRSSPDRRRKLTILTRIYLEFCSVR